MKLRQLRFLLLCLLLWPYLAVKAQDSQPPGPVYVVQPGDTVWTISLRLGVSADDLIRYNQITNPNLLKIGDRLVIPYLEDIQGEIKIASVPFGETQRSLSRKYQLPESVLARLNHRTSPALFYAGAHLVLLSAGEDVLPARRALLGEGETLLELAVLSGTNPWHLASLNHLKGLWNALPGDVLMIPGKGEAGPGALPPSITSITLDPMTLLQGKTVVLRVTAPPGVRLAGSLTGHELHFFSESSQGYVALQGIHAMQEPGLHPLTISGVMPDGKRFDFVQRVLVTEGEYLYELIPNVDPATLNPEVTRPEDAEWLALAEPVTEEKFWSGQFQAPVAEEFAECWSSWFGSRRSYNEGPYNFFHTGLDFCGSVGNPVFAPADGVIVFAGPLTVRGNAIMINHGWGVYTGYMHLSETLVQAGEHVSPGQQIGRVGNTGRVTGPHLHFEVWVGGVQVDPVEWLQKAYP